MSGWGPRAFVAGTLGAILAHAAVDFVPALFQRGQVSAEVATVELIVLTMICARPFLLEKKRVERPDCKAACRVLLPPRTP